MSSFSFGSTRVSQKIGYQQKVDEVLCEHFVPGKPYYLFLVDSSLHKLYVKLLTDDLTKANIDSYLIVSAIMTATPKDDSTVALLSIESNWRQYVTFNGVSCECIVAFGSVIRVLNKSADVTFYDFLDDKFNHPRYFCGSEFIGGPDKWIYPVADVKSIYPVESGDPTNMYTRFFREQIRRIKTDDMSTDELDMRDYEIIVPPTKEEASIILKSLFNSELLAADTETNSFNFLTGKLGCVQLCNDGQKAYVFDWSLIDRRLLKQVFVSAKRTVLVNAKFDVKFLWKNGVNGWLPTDDAMLLAHAINSNRPKGLKPQAIFECGKFTGYDNKLDETKKKLHIDNYLQIPKQILYQYAGLDAIVSWRLLVALEKHCLWVDHKFPNEKISEWTIWRWYKEVMMPNANAVTEVEFEGVYFSLDQFDKAEKLFTKKIEGYKKKLSEDWKVPVTFEFESTQKLGQLFKQMGWPEVELSKAGEFKTSDTVLTEYERLKMPGIDTLKNLRSFNVAMGTFIKGWRKWIHRHEDGTDRIHPNCNCFGAESYRHTMSDPNFQQTPSGSTIAKDIKKLFITPPSVDSEKMFKITQKYKTYFGKAKDKIKTKRGVILFEELIESDEII
jgi:hypothetical protein